MSIFETNKLMNCPLCVREGKASPLNKDFHSQKTTCPVHGEITDNMWLDAETLNDQKKKKGIETIDIPAELDRAIREIKDVDPREDQFRSLKVLLIYNASLLERIVGFIDSFMAVEPKE